MTRTHAELIGFSLNLGGTRLFMLRRPQCDGQALHRQASKAKAPPGVAPAGLDFEGLGKFARARLRPFYGIMTNRRLSHGRQAARRVDFRVVRLGAPGDAIR